MATLERVRSLTDPLKGYQAKIFVTDPPGGEGASGELIQYRATVFTLPGRTVDVVTTNLGGYTVQDAGRSTEGKSWTVTFAEGTDVSIFKRMKAWSNICYNPETGVQGSREDYKRRITVEVFTNDASTVSHTEVLIGAWPNIVGEPSFDLNSSENVTFDVTFAYEVNV